MNKVQKFFAASVAGVSLLLNVSLPVFASTATYQITGNGSDTQNQVNVDMNQSTGVEQTNNANIVNKVETNVSTGGNQASRTTGGDTSISTGNADATVAVTNTANSNVADVEDCGNCGGEVLGKISGNGDGSKNTLNLDIDQGSNAGTYVTQQNNAKVANIVSTNANTGNNRAERTTGGNVEITTGNATETVDVVNTVNSNSALVAGGNSGSSSGVSAQIVGNGDSTNRIDLNLDRTLLVDQGNSARVLNYVESDAKTGGNRVSRTTGGSVMVDTGDAMADVSVDTMANFNWADVDCDCVMGFSGLISGNGDSSSNKIDVALDDVRFVTQSNGGSNYPYPYMMGMNMMHRMGGMYHGDGFENMVDTGAMTGYNMVAGGTGEVADDPSVTTGDASATVDVMTTGNSNVYGNLGDMDLGGVNLPWGGVNVNLSFNLEDLIGWLMNSNNG